MNLESTKTFTFPETGETVALEEASDPTRRFYRLRINQYVTDWTCYCEDVTDWTCYYEGILKIASRVDPKVHYIYLSQYWDGVLPTETVLLVKHL